MSDLLLDTQGMLWFFRDDPLLSRTANKDPFDRMLVAQAMIEGIPIVSADPIFDHYGITRLWD